MATATRTINGDAFTHRSGKVSLDQLLDLGCKFTPFSEISAEVAKLWKPVPYQSFVDWMDENFYLAAESSASEGKWKTLPFQRGPSFAMADPRIRTFAEQKPAQKGASKRLTGYVGYSASRLRRNVILYQPTKDDASDYANTQFLSMLKTCPAVAKTLRTTDPEKIDRDNTQKRRVFEGAIVYIRAGNTGTNFRRITGDDIIFDDLDGATKSVRGASTKKEGSVRVKMEGRANASRRPKFIYISTPTKSGTSLIEDIGKSITQHFKRWFPCPYEECNKPFQFEFGMLTLTHLNKRERELARPQHGLMWDFDITDREKAAETAHYCCPHCKGKFDQSSMQWMDRNGWWQSQDYKQRDSDGEFTDLEGNWVEPPVEVFYQYSGIISYDQPWSTLVNKWLRAKEALDRGDEDDMIGFYNEDMGMVWVPPNLSEFRIEELIGRLAEYPRTPINQRIQRVTWSCDVQGAGYYDWELVGWAPGQESWSIDTGIVVGDPTDKNCKSWGELDDMVKEQFPREGDGRMMSIDLCFMDARFQPDNVKRWCSLNARGRMAAQGQTNPYAQIVKVKTPGKNDHRCFTAMIGVHKASEKLYRMLGVLPPRNCGCGCKGDATKHVAGPNPVYGMCHFPYRAPYYEVGEGGLLVSDYFKQFTAEKRVEHTDQNGQVDFRYVKEEGLKNEKHDARKMNIAAIETVEVFFGRKLMEPLPPEAIADPEAAAVLGNIIEGVEATAGAQ